MLDDDLRKIHDGFHLPEVDEVRLWIRYAHSEHVLLTALRSVRRYRGARGVRFLSATFAVDRKRATVFDDVRDVILMHIVRQGLMAQIAFKCVIEVHFSHALLR